MKRFILVEIDPQTDRVVAVHETAHHLDSMICLIAGDAYDNIFDSTAFNALCADQYYRVPHENAWQIIDTEQKS